MTKKKSKGLQPTEMRPQEHGGALRRGNPGNKGGKGRTPNKVREEVRDLMTERGLKELRRRMGPKNIQKITHQDFARYMDVLGKYGIGTKQEISGPDDGPISHGVLVIPGASVPEEPEEEPIEIPGVVIGEDGEEAPS